MRSRGRVRRIVSWNNQSRHVDGDHFFRLGAGCGVPIKESLPGRKNDPQVSLQILTRKTLGKFFTARDLCRPRTSFRIHPKAFSAARPLDHSAKSVLFGKIIMPRKALTTVYFPAVAADRPVKQKPARCLRIGDAKRERDRTAHTAAHDPCRIELQMFEQRFGVAGVCGPAEPFHSSAGLTPLAPIIENQWTLRPATPR